MQQRTDYSRLENVDCPNRQKKNEHTDLKSLRSIYIKRRKELADHEDLSLVIQKKVLELDEYREADACLLYADYNHEVKTDMIIEDALRSGKKVYMPVCEPECRLDFYKINGFESLHEGAYGILEPYKEELFTGEGDCICITPGVIFDTKGNRVGYGKGYYDRFFQRFDITSVGLCYEMQLSDSIIPSEYDRPMDIIITERNTYVRH